jgi:tetratricopeptide (TPR) repeat protein
MPRRRAIVAVVSLLLSVVLRSGAGAQPPPEVTEREEVTAIDLLVEVSAKNRAGVSGPPPKDLAADDFEVSENRQSLPIIGIELPDRQLLTEPWHIVLYFDLALSSSHAVRWAASELADWVPELLALGKVEVVVADPEPRRVLAPSRDPELLGQTLSGIFLEREGEEELVALREDFLVAKEDEPQLLGSERARPMILAERRVIRRQQDELLNLLVRTQPPTSRRALFLVSGGFDLRPEEFYRQHTSSAEEEEAPEPWSFTDLADETALNARTISAYGWIVTSLAPPPPTVGPDRGLVPGDMEHGYLVRLKWVGARLDGNLNPKKARALNELGVSLREQGRLEEAEETFRGAIHYFYNHPKHSAEQAEALVNLGETLGQMGRQREARQAFRRAVAFDPGRASDYAFIGGHLDEPLASLRLLSQATSGPIVATSEELAEAVAGLGRRVRITFQVGGVPDGELHHVAVNLERYGYGIEAPRWVRLSTPPAVAALRLRRLLAGELETGELKVDCHFRSSEELDTGFRGEVLARLRAGSEGWLEGEREDTPLRVSIGLGGPELEPLVLHDLVPLGQAVSSGEWLYRREVDPSEGYSWLAVVVEDLATGVWGGGMTEAAGSGP